jgi:hypothetical protein
MTVGRFVSPEELVLLRRLQSWSSIALLGFAALVAGYPGSTAAQEELNRKAKVKVAPAYPELARRINVRGTV